MNAIKPCKAKYQRTRQTGKTRWHKTDETSIKTTCPKGCKTVYTVKTYTKQLEMKTTFYKCTRGQHIGNHKWKEYKSEYKWRNTTQKRYETKYACGHK